MKHHKQKGCPYSEKERLIFSFHDGEKKRKVDPLAIQRDLASAKDLDLELDLKILSTNSPEGPQVLTRLLTSLRQVFKIKTLDEGGLTDLEVLEVMVDYAQWVNDLKKKARLTRIMRPSTALPGPLPTRSTSDSTSTDSGAS